MVVPTVFNPASEARKSAFCIAVLSIIIIWIVLSRNFHTSNYGQYLVFYFSPHSIILNKTIILANNQKHDTWMKIPSYTIWSIEWSEWQNVNKWPKNCKKVVKNNMKTSSLYTNCSPGPLNFRIRASNDQQNGPKWHKMTFRQ